MSNIIEHDGDDLNGSLSVDGGQSSVSLETYQAIYQKITGRSEKTVQKYHDNILVDFSELEQMHMKVMQLCDVHTIIAQNEVVTVFHEKERKEQFVSFDDFKRYNSSSSKPTVSVVIKYNFSILPPKEPMINSVLRVCSAQTGASTATAVAF
ncbi:hypothetical protein [Cobetia sp. MC34]|uniref:hypothetical protein n=1 Tax=Cobetia sp. MC34 TaxID=2785080 RepID=UPI001BCA1B7D|nr:hypothetical protein [Cobetia sp. MC34]MBS4154199.1 hypothetical protein [Cobetia sp. MC34]